MKAGSKSGETRSREIEAPLSVPFGVPSLFIVVGGEICLVKIATTQFDFESRADIN